MRGSRIRALPDRVDLDELDENPEGIISGEWPENFSLLSYEDLRAHLEPEIFKEKVCHCRSLPLLFNSFHL